MVAHQQDDVFAHGPLLAGARFGTDRENGCEEECVGTSGVRAMPLDPAPVLRLSLIHI